MIRKYEKKANIAASIMAVSLVILVVSFGIGDVAYV